MGGVVVYCRETAMPEKRRQIRASQARIPDDAPAVDRVVPDDAPDAPDPVGPVAPRPMPGPSVYETRGVVTFRWPGDRRRS